MNDFDLILALLFFLVAVLYSSVGHAGASGYIAVMSLAGLAPSTIRPVALCLNVIVASIALWRFSRAGLVPWSMLWPFVLGSVPMAWWASHWVLPNHVFKMILGVLLLFAAIRLIWQSGLCNYLLRRNPSESIEAVANSKTPINSPSNHLASAFEIQRRSATTLWWCILAGALIGSISGLTGTGGAIFLTPLILFARLATTKIAAGVSSGFVLATSLAGLFGQASAISTWPASMPIWLVAVACGGLLGSSLGVFRFSESRLQEILALVLFIAGAKLIFA